ncbi:MAG: ABC transporter permease [Phycisphaerae bacterium]
MYKLFLTTRFLRTRRIAYFAIGAVTLCAAMVLIVMSIMGGFLDQLKSKARGLLGDLIVENRSVSGFPLYDEFIAAISTWPEVVRATPVLYTYGLLRFPQTEQTETVRAVGVRLGEVYEVNAFHQSLFYEKHYPGTTSLAAQQQPLMGFDLLAPPITLYDSKGERLGDIAPFILPAPFQEAYLRAREAGAVDDDSVLSEPEQMLVRNNVAPFPGVYETVEKAGPPEMSGDPRPGLIIGRDIVAERKADGRYRRYSFYPRGCVVTLTVLPISMRGTVSDTPIKQPFRYVDDSRTGIYEIDSKSVYCDFDLLQRLLEMEPVRRVDSGELAPPRCHQIQMKVRLGPNDDPLAIARRLENEYHALLERAGDALDAQERRLVEQVRVLTWEQSQAHIIAPVEKERVLMSIVLGVISLVAVMLVLCILYMIVLQKTRDIGILKAIGGSSGGVAAIFLVYGAAVGIVGGVLGSVLGVVFVRNINAIQDFLIRFDPRMRVWDLTVYSFDQIPDTVRTEDVALVLATAVLASTAGALAAAWRAGAMQPVEAIRYE